MNRTVTGTALVVVSVLSACFAEPPPPPVSAEIGQPLPGLTPAERARFDAGQALFRRGFAPEEGLGPRFNENACNACHTFPADGGTGETSVRKATRVTADGQCDPLAELGGENLRIQVTPAATALGAAPVRSLDAATHTATFTIPFIFGLGLVDAVPQETLEDLADPDDLDGDGISGRLGVDGAGRPARFGRKADVATLADFVDSAFRLEMGLTTPRLPREDRAGSIPSVPEGVDPAPEPEVSPEVVTAVEDFVRFLAPPSQADRPDDPSVQEGRELFRSLGCAACHVPELRTGDHASPAIAGRSVALFSDLLLHDMGSELVATCGPGAAPSELRTEPLLGLRFRSVFLHDGRAGRVMDAVLLHGGEARIARDAFAELPRLTQESLLRFLETL